MYKSNNMPLLKEAVRLITHRAFQLPGEKGWTPVLNSKEIEFVEAVKRLEKENECL